MNLPKVLRILEHSLNPADYACGNGYLSKIAHGGTGKLIGVPVAKINPKGMGKVHVQIFSFKSRLLHSNQRRKFRKAFEIKNPQLRWSCG
jgi:hypothetical protein